MAEVYRIVGKWLGSGTVVTRNIPYSEEISIVPFGTPNGAVYNFTSKTWAPQGDYDTTPMHTETGILK